MKLKTFPVSKIKGYGGNIVRVGDKLYSVRGVTKKNGKVVGIKAYSLKLTVKHRGKK
jgi:hypothetical protein